MGQPCNNLGSTSLSQHCFRQSKTDIFQTQLKLFKSICNQRFFKILLDYGNYVKIFLQNLQNNDVDFLTLYQRGSGILLCQHCLQLENNRKPTFFRHRNYYSNRYYFIKKYNKTTNCSNIRSDQ